MMAVACWSGRWLGRPRASAESGRTKPLHLTAAALRFFRVQRLTCRRGW
jgi:hypothetical protein